MGTGIILSIINHKGGCGKSTVTVNLADALARTGKKILVVDMDPQSNTSSVFVPPSKMQMRYCLYEFFDKETANIPIEALIYPTDYANIYCLPNTDDTSALESEIITGAPTSLQLLRDRLRGYATENFDYTILDNPPNMGSFVYCSLSDLDFVIVPIKASSVFSLKGLAKAMQRIEEVQNNGNRNLRFLRLLINMLDKRTLISRSVLAQVKDSFDSEMIFETSIPVNTAFDRAEANLESVLRYDSACAGAKAFKDLAKELTSIIGVDGYGRAKAEA
jgi:cellulose biosynthesis protein BcsQ